MLFRSPRNIDFVLASLQRYIAPSIYQEMSQAMLEQAKAIKAGNYAMSFAVQEIVYEEGQRVLVKGQATMHGPFGKQTLSRTYEYAIAIRNYAPVITEVLVHDQQKQPGEEKEG